MKFHPGEAARYYKSLPPTAEEDQAEYTERIETTLTEWEVVHDNEDVLAIVGLAVREKALRVDVPVPVVPVVTVPTAATPSKSRTTTKKPEKPKQLTSKEKALAMLEKQKSDLDTNRIYYFPDQATFEKHIFEGEPDGNSHKGLHSLCVVNTMDKSKQPKVAVGEQDTSVDSFVATVTFPGKEPKASSFFPTAWNRAKVLEVIDQAIRTAWKSQSQSRSEGNAAGLTWATTVQVPGGAMLIGGIGGDGASPSGAVHTVFPGVGGKFHKL